MHRIKKIMNNRSNIIIILLVVIIGVLLYNNCNPKTQSSATPDKQTETQKEKTGAVKAASSNKIDELTKESVVVPYVKSHGKLPGYYITKREAREKGWEASLGNLCEALPGRAIGGDVFTNREGNLPEKPGRKWFEADLNYDCGRRNADRLLFSSDGLVFVTHDHYKTFEEK